MGYKGMIRQSPALELLHELGHVYRRIFDGIRLDETKPTSQNFAEYYKAHMTEEQYVVDNFESPAAGKLPNEGIRRIYQEGKGNHYYPTNSPTSYRKKRIDET